MSLELELVGEAGECVAEEELVGGVEAYLCDEGAVVLSEFLVFAALVDQGFAEQDELEGTHWVGCLVIAFAGLVHLADDFGGEVVAEVEGGTGEDLFPVEEAVVVQVVTIECGLGALEFRC